MTDETTTEQLAEIEGQARIVTPDDVAAQQFVRGLVLQVAAAIEEEETAEQQAVPVQVREGRWRTRNGNIRNVTPTPAYDSRAKRWPWRDAKSDQTWREDGGHHVIGESPWDLIEYLDQIEQNPQPATETEPETTTEQLVEIEGQAEDTPATEYTPPEGWRVVQFGEPLRGGDEYDSGLNRYIRRIEPQPEPQPQPEPEPQLEQIQVCEGRWRTRGGDIKNIRPCEPLKGSHFVWPWTDGFMTYQDNGRHQGSQESPNDLVEYLGPIEEQPETQQEPQPDPEQIEELRSEVSHVQRLLGESRQRVTQLEELVASLRTINETQEKAFTAAGKENTALRNQLAAVKAELASVAADRQRLRVELDAAQQVPADSPELRQLRLDLAEVTQDRDTYRHAHELLVQDIDARHQRTKVMTVETIAEWLEPIKGAIDAADNQDELARAGCFAIDTIRHLPAIMRTLTGLTPED